MGSLCISYFSESQKIKMGFMSIKFMPMKAPKNPFWAHHPFANLAV